MTGTFEKTTAAAANSNSQSKHPGLLPTSSVNVGDASRAPRGASQFVAGADMYSSVIAGHHDPEYYENWNRERQEAIDRGEDPNAKFLALVKQREQEGYQGKMRRLVGRFRGKKSSKRNAVDANDATGKFEGGDDDGVIR